MPDVIDNLLEREAYIESHTERKPSLDEEDRKRLDNGIMTKAAAQKITDTIKSAAIATYAWVKQAHDGKAWIALGYKTWVEYIKKEFDMSSSRSYQLISQANIINELEAATPDGTRIMLTEKQARDIKDDLQRITGRVREETTGLTPEEASKRTTEIVDEEREAKRASLKKNDATAAEMPDAAIDERKLPPTDRLSPKDSGSTADDGLDLDADIPPVKKGVKKGDGFDFDAMTPQPGGKGTSADDDENATTLGYVFDYFDMLSSADPLQVVKAYAGKEAEAMKSASNAIEWLVSFKRAASEQRRSS